jgi:hypothetical protein
MNTEKIQSKVNSLILANKNLLKCEISLGELMTIRKDLEKDTHELMRLSDGLEARAVYEFTYGGGHVKALEARNLAKNYYELARQANTAIFNSKNI